MQGIAPGKILGFVLVLLGSAHSDAADVRHPHKPIPSPSAPTVEQQLKTAVSQSIDHLGVLDLAQKKLFLDEVVAGYSTFILDYRPTDKGLSVAVDYDSIKSYLQVENLKFFPSSDPKQGATKAAKILTYVHAETGCPKCLESLNGIKELVKARVEARGFSNVGMSFEETKDSSLSGKEALTSKLTELMTEQNAVGAIYLSVGPTGVDDIDTAHPDEQRFKIGSWAKLKEGFRTEGELDLTNHDDFIQSAGRLLTDAWTDLGHQMLATPVDTEASSSEVLVKIKNLQTFDQVVAAQSQLSSRLKSLSLGVEQRKISRNEVVFAIPGAKSNDQIKRLLQGLPLDWGLNENYLDHRHFWQSFIFSQLSALSRL